MRPSNDELSKLLRQGDPLLQFLGTLTTELMSISIERVRIGCQWCGSCSYVIWRDPDFQSREVGDVCVQHETFLRSYWYTRRASRRQTNLLRALVDGGRGMELFCQSVGAWLTEASCAQVGACSNQWEADSLESALDRVCATVRANPSWIV